MNMNNQMVEEVIGRIAMCIDDSLTTDGLTDASSTRWSASLKVLIVKSAWLVRSTRLESEHQPDGWH